MSIQSVSTINSSMFWTDANPKSKTFIEEANEGPYAYGRELRDSMCGLTAFRWKAIMFLTIGRPFSSEILADLKTMQRTISTFPLEIHVPAFALLLLRKYFSAENHKGSLFPSEYTSGMAWEEFRNVMMACVAIASIQLDDSAPGSHGISRIWAFRSFELDKPTKKFSSDVGAFSEEPDPIQDADPFLAEEESFTEDPPTPLPKAAPSWRELDRLILDILQKLDWRMPAPEDICALSSTLDQMRKKTP